MKLENKHILILSIFVLILAFGAFKFNSNSIESITGAVVTCTGDIYQRAAMCSSGGGGMCCTSSTTSYEGCFGTYDICFCDSAVSCNSGYSCVNYECVLSDDDGFSWPGVKTTGDARCAYEGKRCITAEDTNGYEKECDFMSYGGSAVCSSEVYGVGVKWPGGDTSTGDSKCIAKPCLKAYNYYGTEKSCSDYLEGSYANYFGTIALCADGGLSLGEDCLENSQCLSGVCNNYICSQEIECTTDYQCQREPWSNYCEEGRCIECYNSDECDVGTCNDEGFCDECNTKVDCDPEEFCWESRRCVDCLTSADCDDGIRLTSDYCNEIYECMNMQVVDCLDDTDCPDQPRLMCMGNIIYDIVMEGTCSNGMCDYVDTTISQTPCEEGYICLDGECALEIPPPECVEDIDCDSGYECKSGVCEEETPPEDEEDEDYDFSIGDTGVYCATSTCDDFSGSIDDCDLYGKGCELECVYQNGVCYLSGGLVESEGSNFDCVTNGYGKCKDGWKTRPPCICTGDVSVCASADDFYTKEHSVECTNVEKFPVFDNFNLLVSMLLLTMYYLVRKRFRHVRSVFCVS